MSKTKKLPKKGEMRSFARNKHSQMRSIGNTSIPRKGEIWLANNPERIKELEKDYRPVLIISNDEQNEYDDKLVVVPLTADDVDKVKLVEVFIKNTPETGLDYPSKILLNYPFTLDKDLRLEKKLGIASKEIMEKVKKAWEIAFVWENKL